MDIGTAAQLVLAKTASSPLCERPQDTDTGPIVAPRNDDEARALAERATRMATAHQPISSAQFADQLEYVAAALPARSIDHDGGKKRVAVYFHTLRHLSSEAVEHACRRACAEMEWLPAPSQLLALAATYVEPGSRRDHALALCQTYWTKRMQEFVERLGCEIMPQEEIDAQPERWRRVAVEAGVLRWEGGRMVQRRAVIDRINGVTPALPIADHEAPTFAYSRSQPTIEDYKALGLSDEDALVSWDEHQRILRRDARPAPLAEAA